MMCGVADEGSAALFVCGGEGRIWLRRRGTCRTDGRGGIGGRMMPMRAVCAAGATTPEPDPGVGGREDRLDLSGGQIGVSLLTGAKFGDRMKKIFPEFFVIDL